MMKDTIVKQQLNENNVNVIPATKRHIHSVDQFKKASYIRVAAYCRVSTQEESQQNSYAAQKSYYTELIFSRLGWEIAGIYADEGKSGTTRKSRINFNQMIEDAKNGKIDYIITKSISRFARNTVDTLDCVHELQRLHPPVGVYFERENIDTLNQNSEMFLTFYCSMAQEESHSISENIKWSIRKKMAEGKPHINLHRMLGYDYDKHKDEWIINEKQADIVRYIFNRFLQGISASGIAKELNKDGKTTVNKKRWRADAILSILRNEKYTGDLLMQKTYTESFLTHKSIKNTGEVTQYFKENHHNAIISREAWKKTQELLYYRRLQTRKQAISINEEAHCNRDRNGMFSSAFDGLICGDCGEKYRRLSYHCTAKNYTDGRVKNKTKSDNYKDFFDFTYSVWKCIATSRSRQAKTAAYSCKSKPLIEISMEQSFMEMLYRIKRDYQLNGEKSAIDCSFKHIYEAVSKKELNSDIIEEKLELLQMEIDKLDAALCDACKRLETASYAAEIKLSIESCSSQAGLIPEKANAIENSIIPGCGIQYERLVNALKKQLDKKKMSTKSYLKIVVNQ